jgi:MtN3 and saliva related transmembrane protein
LSLTTIRKRTRSSDAQLINTPEQPSEKILRSGDTSSISLRMYGLFTAGIALWAVYGFFVRDGPMIVANLVTLVPAGIVLERKLQAVRAKRK